MLFKYRSRIPDNVHGPWTKSIIEGFVGEMSFTCSGKASVRVTEKLSAKGFRMAKSKAALLGAIVCELEGPLPILKISLMLSIDYKDSDI